MSPLFKRIPPAAEKLINLVETISRSGDPNKPFHYLGGPMTGIPQFNFPAFWEAGARLRAQGWNVISPAELDDPETEAAAVASPDGAPGSGIVHEGQNYASFLERDLTITAMPTCVGGVFLPGWEHSRGAQAETWQLSFLNKPIRLYEELLGTDGFTLRIISRDYALRKAGVVAHEVPSHAPGVLTAERNGNTVIMQTRHTAWEGSD